jgi:hypothetical protein
MTEKNCSIPGRGYRLLSETSRPVLWPTQFSIQRVARALSQGARWPGSEANHSPHSNAEVKNERIHTSTPPYAFMTCKRAAYLHL